MRPNEDPYTVQSVLLRLEFSCVRLPMADFPWSTLLGRTVLVRTQQSACPMAQRLYRTSTSPEPTWIAQHSSPCCVAVSGASMTIRDSSEAAEVAAQAGSFTEKAAAAGSPARGTLSRLGKGAAAVKVGARLLPAFWRFVRRHPVGGSMAIVALVGVAYWMRADSAR